MEYMAKAKAGQGPAAGAHGSGVRGDQVFRGSRVFEGRFGRMFRTLPPAEFDRQALKLLGEAMSAEPERASEDDTNPDFHKPAAAEEIHNESFHDGEENTGIPAGYTYLGQFIDHDITFDPASSLQKQNDPDGLVDFRSPALDLDCVYGRGPEDQPYMFDGDGKTFLLGEDLTFVKGGPRKTSDLPRFGPNHRAVIGDKRNDENVIVSQLQSVFLQFHNRLVRENPELDFKEIQRLVRWHYQYVVLNDFLPIIVGPETMNKVWPNWSVGNICGNAPQLCFYHPRKEAYIPIEFSAAAYRFGHSMVRPIYRLNTKHDDSVVGQGDHPGLAGRFFIFAGVQERGLNGFGRFPSHWAIDWSLFFDIDGSGEKRDKERVQPTYKIDTSLVNPLAFLPEFSDPVSFDAVGAKLTLDQKPKDNLRPKELSSNSPSNLAVRNLWRGNSMGLPSGQDVARAMGERPLLDDELVIGKAQRDDLGDEDLKRLSDITLPEPRKTYHFNESTQNYDSIAKPAFPPGQAPLWYYVLAEAHNEWRKKTKYKKGDDANRIPATLGPVGGRIVAETLIGLLVADSHSYVNQFPKWKPEPPIAGLKKSFTMGDFIKYALAQ
jgi:Animal haem peroxidase